MKKYLLHIFVFLLLNISSNAQPGALDNSFGIGGKVTTDFGGSVDDGWSIATQSDGKIVFAGRGSGGIIISRYDSHGTLDNTFDFDGRVSVLGGIGANGYAVAIQNDGKIVVAGNSFLNGIDYDITLIRINSNGSLDSTFDFDGIVTTDFGGTYDFTYSIGIQNDGKIVVVGFNQGAGNDNIILARYNSNGSLDNTFDFDGKVETDMTGTHEYGFSLAIQTNGKIVVAGRAWNGNDFDFALLRYNTDGSLDNTFDFDGKVITSLGNYQDGAYSVALQNDEKIVVGGWVSNFNPTYDDFALVRYNMNGSLDSTFDFDGIVLTDFGGMYDVGRSVEIQSDGKIVIGGWTGVYPYNMDFALVRCNTDGSLDNTFDLDGRVVTDFGSGTDFCYTICLQTDGKILAGGTYSNGSNADFAIARYNTVSTSIEENVTDYSFELYPNPSSGIFNLKGEITQPKISVHDVLGNCVWDKEYRNEADLKIDLSDQPKGIYFVEISIDDKRAVRKNYN